MIIINHHQINEDVSLEQIAGSKIELLRGIRSSKFGNMKSFGETDVNVRTHGNPKWERTRCPEEYM